MATAISVSQALGLLFGILIFLVGYFVLKAKPHSRLHQLFCAFAMADGASTFAFSLSQIPGGVAFQLHAYLAYFHAFIAFVALLVCFGLIFPRPLLPAGLRWSVIGVIIVGAFGAIAWHAFDPYAFWFGRPQADGTVAFSYGPAGRLVLAVWVGATAGVITRLALLLRTEPSPTHRRQAAFVLGGIALGYAPYATTTFVAALQRGFLATLFSSPSAFIVYSAILIAILVLIWATVVLVVDHRPERRDDRRVALACFAGVALLTLASILFPGRGVSILLQNLGLLAYPLLLVYAIARYEILDIGPTVRRTATISLAGTVLASVFFLAEAGLENLLQARFTGALGIPIAAVLIASVVTALVFTPLARVARRFARKVAPEMHGDTMRQRQMEIYTHGLEAALADGVIDVTENRVLASMRATLGISVDDHQRILREVGVRYGVAPV